MNSRSTRFGLALCGVVCAVQVSAAPISYTTAGGTYSQDFNTLPLTLSAGTQMRLGNTVVQELFGTVTGTETGGTGQAAFGTGTEGWFYSRQEASPAAGTTLQFTPVTRLTATTPALLAAIGSAYSFADTSSTADVALGLMGSGTSPGGLHIIGAEFINNTGSTLNKFTITFDMEEWRKGASGVNTMSFGYAVGGTNIRTGTFTSVAALNMVAKNPQLSPNDNWFDGNLAANRTAGVTATITGLTWTNGQKLVIRWQDANESGNDDGLAVDNFSFSADVLVTKNLVWNTHPTGTWDSGVGANLAWLNGVPTDFFTNGDNATFSQTPSPTSITVAAGGVSPNTFAVSHTSGTYTFTGAGITGPLSKSNAGDVVFSNTGNNLGAATISGGSATFDNATTFASLAVSGGSSVVLKAANTNPGGVTITGSSSVEARIGGALGAGTATVTSGSLLFTTANQTLTNVLSLGTAATVDVVSGLTVTLNSAYTTSGTTRAVKTGDGTWITGGSGAVPAFKGHIDVQGGRLKQGGTGNFIDTGATNIGLVRIAAGAIVDETSGDGDGFGGLANSGGSGTGTLANPFGIGGTGGTYLALAGATVGYMEFGSANLNTIFSGKITGGPATTSPTNGVEGVTAAARNFGNSGSGSFAKTGTGRLLLDGSTSNFNAQVRVVAGTLAFSNVADKGTASALGEGNSQNVGTTVDILIGSVINGGAGTGAATLEYTGATLNSTNRTISLASSGALTISTSDANGTLRLNGVINSTATPSSLTKDGDGTLDLRASNTFAGASLIVAKGKLLLNNPIIGSATSGANLTVASGATLGGGNAAATEGRMSGNLVNNGSVAPGNSIGTLTVSGNVTFGASSSYDVEIDALGNSDNLIVGGNLDLNANQTLNVTGASGAASYTIVQYTGTLSGAFDVENIPSGYIVDYGTGTNSVITLNVVPEPATWALLGLGGCAVALVRRRCRPTVSPA